MYLNKSFKISSQIFLHILLCIIHEKNNYGINFQFMEAIYYFKRGNASTNITLTLVESIAHNLM